MKTRTLQPPRFQQTSFEEAMTLFPSCHPERPVIRRISATTEIEILRLRLILYVEIDRSVWKIGHRHFVLRVIKRALHRVPSLPGSSTYELQPRYSTMRHLSADLHERCKASASCCRCCRMLITNLLHDHNEPTLRNQYSVLHASQFTRLQRFFTDMLQHIVCFMVPNAAECIGCEWAIKILAAFLKEPFQRSTGLI